MKSIKNSLFYKLNELLKQFMQVTCHESVQFSVLYKSNFTKLTLSGPMT